MVNIIIIVITFWKTDRKCKFWPITHFDWSDTSPQIIFTARKVQWKLFYACLCARSRFRSTQALKHTEQTGTLKAASCCCCQLWLSRWHAYCVVHEHFDSIETRINLSYSTRYPRPLTNVIATTRPPPMYGIRAHEQRGYAIRITRNTWSGCVMFSAHRQLFTQPTQPTMRSFECQR